MKQELKNLSKNELIKIINQQKKELKKKEEIQVNFRKMAEVSSSVFWMLTADWSRVIYMSNAIEKIFGIPPERFYKNSRLWLRMMYKEDRRKLLEFYSKHPKISQSMEVRAFVDGKIKWLKVITSPICDEKGNIRVIAGITHDIDEQKKYERRIENAKDKIENLVNNLPECIWQYKMKTNEFTVSKSIEKILGYTSDEFSDRKKFVHKLIHPVHRNMVENKWQQLENRQKLFNIKYKIKDKSGKYIWVQESVFRKSEVAKNIIYDGLIRDIDQDKKSKLIRDIIYNIVKANFKSKSIKELVYYVKKSLKKLYSDKNILIALKRGGENEKIFYYPDKSQEIMPDLLECVFKQKRPLIFNYKQIKDKTRKTKNHGYKVWIGSPLKNEDKVFGVISLKSDKNENDLNLSDLEVLKFISYQISQSILHQMYQMELRISEQRKQLIFDVLPDLIFQIDKEGRFLDYKGERFYIEPKKFINKTVFEVLPKSLARKTYNYIQKVLKFENIEKYQYSLTNQGRKGFFETRMVKLKEDVVLAIIRDITERVKAENKVQQSLEDKVVLLQEIHHRVKNNMQIISSILNMQISESEENKIQQLLIQTQNRIRSMSLVHEKLYESNNYSQINIKSYVESLVYQMISSYSSRAIRINVVSKIDNIKFNLNTAIPIGLIINELIINTYKYSFGRNENGTVEIKIFKNQDFYELHYSDNGKLMPENFELNSTENMSLQLVQILVKQVDGQINYIKDNKNLYRLTFLEQE